jgi:hypothetical protein
LYNEVRNLVHKYLGIDKIIDHILSRLGDLHLAFIVGDYARGKDSGTIELVLVGNIDKAYLQRITAKAKGMLHRNIDARIISLEQFLIDANKYEQALLVWGQVV